MNYKVSYDTLFNIGEYISDIDQYENYLLSVLDGNDFKYVYTTWLKPKIESQYCTFYCTVYIYFINSTPETNIYHFTNYDAAYKFMVNKHMKIVNYIESDTYVTIHNKYINEIDAKIMYDDNGYIEFEIKKIGKHTSQ